MTRSALALQHFGGQTGDHVGLVDRRGNAHAGGALDHWDSWHSRRCPPPDRGGSRRRMARARLWDSVSMVQGAQVVGQAPVAPGSGWKPADGDCSGRRSPPCSTRSRSMPSGVPTNSTCSLADPAPAYSLARARAGFTWPAVPPQVKITFMSLAASYPAFPGHGICRETLSTMPISASWHQQRRAAIAEEGQGNAGGGHQARDHGDVQKGLQRRSGS